MKGRSGLICTVISLLLGGSCAGTTSSLPGARAGDDASIPPHGGESLTNLASDACGSSPGDSMCETRMTPGTKTEYCIKAHPDCAKPGTACPLYLTFNLGSYFDRVGDPACGKIVAVQAKPATWDGTTVKDYMAELPRVIGADYPGLDWQRIFAIGFSAGVGSLYRGLCQKVKGYDTSSYGTTSDIYAAMVAMGGCPGCDNGFFPIPAWNVLTVNGTEDTFATDGCKAALTLLAGKNGCSLTSPTWCPPPSTDPLLPRNPGGNAIQKLVFGDCPGGDVLGYWFAGEGHVLRYAATDVDPTDIAWRFLNGRTKTAGGVTGSGNGCGP